MAIRLSDIPEKTKPIRLSDIPEFEDTDYSLPTIADPNAPGFTPSFEQQPTYGTKTTPQGLTWGPGEVSPAHRAKEEEPVPKERYDKRFIEDMKAVGQAINIMTDPTNPESQKIAGELYDRMSWFKTYVVSLGGRVGPKGLRRELLEEAGEFGGFGPAVMPAAGKTVTLAVEWGILYPALFRAAGYAGGLIGRIPKVQQGIKALKSLGGIAKVAKEHPQLYAAAENALKAFGKGETVGQTMAAIESIAKDKPFEQWVIDMNKRGALMGGIATVFSAAHSYDNYRHITQTSKYLKMAAYQRHQERISKGMPEKTSGELLRQEGDKIKDVIYYYEAELLGQPKELLGGKKPKLTAKQAAEKLAKHGYNFAKAGKSQRELAEIKQPKKPLDVLLRPKEAMIGKTKVIAKVAPKADHYLEFTETTTGRKVAMPAGKYEVPKGWTTKKIPFAPAEAPPPPVTQAAEMEQKPARIKPEKPTVAPPVAKVTPEPTKIPPEAVTEGEVELPETKVIDEAGEPLIVYHGTKYTFKKGVFSTEELGKATKAASAQEGFFFTKDKVVAEGYAEAGDTEKAEKLAEKYIVLEKKAQRTGKSEDWDAYDKAYLKYEKEALKEHQAKALDPSRRVEAVYLDIKNPLIKDYQGESFRDEKYVEVIKRAKEQGRDGVIFKNTYDNVGIADTIQTDIYVVFNASQIIKQPLARPAAEAKPEGKPPAKITSGYPAVEFEFTGRWSIQERKARHIPGPTVKGQKRKARKFKVPIYRSAEGKEILYMEGAVEVPIAKPVPPKAAEAVTAKKLTTQQEGMKTEALRTAEKEGIEIAPSGNLVLYHGTRSGAKIRESGNFPIGSYFAADKAIAKRYAEQAQQKGKAEVMRVEVPPHTVFPSGIAEELYFSANESIPVAEAVTEGFKHEFGIESYRAGDWSSTRSPGAGFTTFEDAQKEMNRLKKATGQQYRVTEYDYKGLVRKNVKQARPTPVAKPETKDEYRARIRAEKAAAKVEETDEKLSGIKKARRRRLIKEVGEDIKKTDIYSSLAEDLKGRPIDVGYYYVPKKFKAEVLDIIGEPKRGRKNALQKMFTFDPREGATDWTKEVQDAMGVEDELGQYDTSAAMDISDFVQAVKDAHEGKKKVGALNAAALERAKESGDPYLEYQINKYEMLRNGFSVDEIDEMTRQWAEDYEVPLEELDTEWVGPEAIKIKDLKGIKDEKKLDAEIEKIARDRVLRQERKDAGRAVNEILKANDLDVEVKEVEEIERERDLLGREELRGGAVGKQGEFLTKEDYRLHEPDIEGQQRMFAGRERPTGAAIVTPAGREIVLLAFGADSETGYHEGYHLLRRRLRKTDRIVLDRHFKSEEAEAEAFGEFAKTNKAPTSMIKAIWQKLLRVLRKIKSALEGQGYRTVGDIFGEIQAGRIAKVAPRGAVKYETRTDRLIRDVMRKARMKAEAAQIKRREMKRRRKGPALKRIKIKIDEKATPGLVDEWLKGIPRPPMPPKPLGKVPVQGQEYSPEWYEQNRKKVRARNILSGLGETVISVGKGIDRAIDATEERLYRLSPELFRRTRKYAQSKAQRFADMIQAIKPFVKATHKMSRADWTILDLALKNRDRRMIYQILAKYDKKLGTIEKYETFRDIEDEIYEAANEVGIDMRYLREHTHRFVKDTKGFLKYFQQTEHWSAIMEAVKSRAKRSGRKIDEITDDEIILVINSLLRGYTPGAISLARPGAAKERTIGTIDKNLNRFYADSRESIIRYLRVMNTKIAAREFFGGETREIRKIRGNQSARLTRLSKYRRGEGLAEGASKVKYRDHIKRTEEALKADNERLERLQARPLEETVGGYVFDLWQAGIIEPTQERELKGLLRSLFDPKGMGRIMSFIKTAMYLDTLNSPIHAVTQLEEISFALYRYRHRAVPALIRTIARKSHIKPKDVGIQTIGIEFEGRSMEWALKTMLASEGFTWADNLGKETLINAALSKLKSQAMKKKRSPAFTRKIVRAFGKNYKEVIEDLKKAKIENLKRGDMPSRVKYLLWCEVADFQPISELQTPQYYNRAGNWRILYTLKTFYLKRFSALRREAFRDMKHIKTFPRGFSNMVQMLFWFALLGAGTDWLKDFILGRAFDLKDSIIDTIARVGLLSKYEIYAAGRDRPSVIVARKLMPPLKIIDAIWRDYKTITSDKHRGFELWRSVPIVGEMYYWWFGRGRERIEEEEETTSW